MSPPPPRAEHQQPKPTQTLTRYPGVPIIIPIQSVRPHNQSVLMSANFTFPRNRLVRFKYFVRLIFSNKLYFSKVPRLSAQQLGNLIAFEVEFLQNNENLLVAILFFQTNTAKSQIPIRVVRKCKK